MKLALNILLIFLSFLVLASCDKIGRTEYEPGLPPPVIVVLEKNIPDDASLTADIKFQVISGVPPYFIYPSGEGFETVDEEEAIFRIRDIHPSIKPIVITAMDSNFKSDTVSIVFSIPEITAKGLFKNEDGSIETINYKFKNFGSENNPNYMLTENVYSNVYSYGENEEVANTIATSSGYEGQKEYTIYTFEQAFGLSAEDYDESTDDFYNPLKANKYNKVYQGICPKYWHIPNNDEWLKTLVDIGLSVDKSPKASLYGNIFDYRYMYADAEKALFEKEFNTGYNYAEGTYPTGTKPGVGYWSSSITRDNSQYVLYFRFKEGNMPLEAWGKNEGRAWYQEHVRCKFDF